jgi:hypothetical protein
LYFDELIPARDIPSKALKHRITRDGVGAPFVAHWKYSEERKKTEPFMTQMGYVVPSTATLEFRSAGGGVREAVLVLHDPRNSITVSLAGSSKPLAADLTASSEYVLANKEARMSGMGAMLNSGKNLNKMGLIALEHPAKDEIPVILVHGLMSRPATWQNVFNELTEDPVIQKRYQIYFFRYPSGVPVVYSAQRFRQDLGILHDQLERQGNHELAHHMVLVGHSMGGLISKMQVTSSGDRFWVSIFGKTPEKSGLTKEEIAELNKYFEFNPNPYVDRVIFVATPHRGSTLAVGTVGAIGRALISLPVKVFSFPFELAGKGGADNSAIPNASPAMREVMQKVPSSIDNLAPDSNFMRVSIVLPVRPGVHVHSIVGNKDMKSLADPACSDGVVPYTSAHLQGVESELVVHSGHGAHETAQAKAEIKRILLLHLRSF